MAEKIRTTLTDSVAEATTALFTGSFVNETGAAIPAAQLATLVLTLYAVGSATLAIVNGVDRVNVLNTGRGTVDSSGNWTMTLTPADNDVVLTPEPLEETHRMLLEWTYSGGTKAGKAEIDFRVRSIGKVT